MMFLKENKKKFSNKKVIIFDFDGTICDSLDAIIKELMAVAPKIYSDKYNLEEFKYKIRHESFSALISEFDVSFLRTFYMVWRIQNKMSKYVEKLESFEGILEVLEKLHKKYELCVLSANSNKNIEKFLRKNEILEFFSFVSGRSSPFDKSKSLKKFLKKHNLNVSDCVYIGDETADLKACRKIGLDEIVVGYGFNSLALFEELEPKNVAVKVEDILKFF